MKLRGMVRAGNESIVAVPLTFPVLAGNKEVAVFLLAHGASTDTLNEQGETPAGSAMRNHHSDCARLVAPSWTHSDEAPLLVLSDLHGNLRLLREALARGALDAGRCDLTVVLMGDYCDNGPEIKQLLECLLSNSLWKVYFTSKGHENQ